MNIISELTDKQYTIFNDIVGSKKAKYFMINASRQSGKTVLSTYVLMNFAINDPGCVILFISPTHAQNKKVFVKIKNGLNDINIIQTQNNSDLEIVLKTNTIIKFRSAERYDNIRGESVDYLFIDEFAYLRKDAWESAIRPTTAARKNAKVIITSTPKGKNVFYQMCSLGMDTDNSKYKYYKMLYSDNPFYDKQEVIDAKKVLPESVFKTEYLAEFISDGTVFSNYNECAVINEYPNYIDERTFAGLDFGKTNDYTVLTIFNDKNQIIHIYRDNKKKWKIIKQNILELLDKYKPIVYIEANNGTINDPLYEDISKQYTNTIAFQTDNNSKSDIIETLILSFNEVEIEIPSQELNEDLHNELQSFEYTYSNKTRKIQYSAPSGLHDDMVMSLALANKCRKIYNTEIDIQTGSYRDYETNNRW